MIIISVFFFAQEPSIEGQKNNVACYCYCTSCVIAQPLIFFQAQWNFT